MSRGLQTRQDAVAAIRLCLLSDLGRLDHWVSQPDFPDAACDALDGARYALMEALVQVAKAEELMPEEER